jgi:hypothetical protein
MPLTPDDLDVVQIIKQEWSSLGGGEGSDLPYSLPLSVIQDGIEIPAIFIVEAGRRNKALAIWSDNGKLRFRDVLNPGENGRGYTLGELIGGAAAFSIDNCVFDNAGGLVYDNDEIVVKRI